MEATILSYSNIHLHGELFLNYFKQRYQSFIIQKKWDLPHVDGIEFDQYDTPASRWVAVHEQGSILGGFRLTPTIAQCGVYSYMIRDAQRGILGGNIPQDLLYDVAPVDPMIWECTRVFVNHDVPMAIRRKVHMLMAGTMTDTARSVGASHLIALTDAKWSRWYGRCGLVAQAIGPVMTIEDDETQCVSIDINLSK